MVDSDSPIGGENWMAIQEDQMGEGYIEAHLTPEPSPDGTRTDIIASLSVAYPLVPTKGRHSAANTHVEILSGEPASQPIEDVGDTTSTFHALAEVYKAGDWGYKNRLADIDSDEQIGLLQANPRFDDSDELAEGDTVPLLINLEYHQEYTGLPGSRIRAARDEAEERREQWREEYFL